MIERAVIFSVHPIILPGDLPQKLLDAIPEKKLDDLIRTYPVLTEKLLSLKDVERNYALKVLQETRGNKKKAAEILGIDRTTLYRILDKN
jgi:DNA-binding NtrC family response regulator